MNRFDALPGETNAETEARVAAERATAAAEAAAQRAADLKRQQQADALRNLQDRPPRPTGPLPGNTGPAPVPARGLTRTFSRILIALGFVYLLIAFMNGFPAPMLAISAALFCGGLFPRFASLALVVGGIGGMVFLMYNSSDIIPPGEGGIVSAYFAAFYTNPLAVVGCCFAILAGLLWFFVSMARA